MDEAQNISALIPIGRLLYRAHGLFTTVIIMAATCQLAATHVTRYTHGASRLSLRNLQLIATALAFILISLTLNATIGTLMPEAAENQPSLTINQHVLAAFTVASAWLAVIQWNKPSIHIPAWILTAAMSTTTAAFLAEGSAHAAIIVLSMLTAAAHLAATFIQPVQRCAMHAYNTTQAAAARGADAAWMLANITAILS